MKRKAGGRVTSKYAFAGEGQSLAGGSEAESSKGKRASSNRAREERAAAAERRLKALLGGEDLLLLLLNLPCAHPSTSESSSSQATRKTEEGSEALDEEGEVIPETDRERRQALLSSKEEDDNVQFLGAGKSWRMFEDEFKFIASSESKNGESSKSGKHLGTIEIPSDDEGCDLPTLSGSTSTIGQASSSQSLKGKTKDRSEGSLGLGKLVQSEIDFRKKESLGLTPTTKPRTLGSSKPKGPSPLELQKARAVEWSCKACTL